MTQPRPSATGPTLPEPQPADAPGPYEALCRQARSLAHDADFLAGLRRCPQGLGDLLRLALELLPPTVLEGELGRALPSPGACPRGWSA